MEAQAIKIVTKLQQAGFQALFAGGCVRDYLIGQEPQDYDIATNASAETVQLLFDNTKAVGEHFGVVLVELDGYSFEVATFRRDGPYRDGRHPEYVVSGSIIDDAFRRDFAINAMFYDPVADVLYDYVAGRQAIMDERIEFVGTPAHRIREDKLRMLRAVRFALRLDFEIRQEDGDAIRQHASEIHQVAPERIQWELMKMLRTRKPRRFFELMHWTGLMGEVLPEVDALRGVEQPSEFHPEGDVWEHTIQVLENLPEDASDELILGALLHDIGKPLTFAITDRIRFNGHDQVGTLMADDVLRRLRFPVETIEHVSHLVANHMKFQYVDKMRISKLKRFMRLPKFEEHMLLHRADCLGCHALLDNYEFVMEKLASFEPQEIDPHPQVQNANRLFTGDDLIALGFKPGPVFKDILGLVEDEQLEGNICDKEAAIAFVQETFPEGVVS